MSIYSIISPLCKHLGPFGHCSSLEVYLLSETIFSHQGIFKTISFTALTFLQVLHSLELSRVRISIGLSYIDVEFNLLTKHLDYNKIQTRNYFAGNILMHPCYSHLDYYKNYPNACKVLDLVFFVGCSPTITQPMIDYIGTITDKFIK